MESIPFQVYPQLLLMQKQTLQLSDCRLSLCGLEVIRVSYFAQTTVRTDQHLLQVALAITAYTITDRLAYWESRLNRGTCVFVGDP
eukprot:2216004-Amphidinium_carterae.1